MILKASTRGNPVALARHLLNDERDNDHVETHEIRGFVSDNVMDAMREQRMIDQGVRSRQTLFSVSLSPPPHEQVDVAVFEDAINEIELRNGLKDQPRIVIFHEKEGRRHAHAVWSRIDPERMTCIPLPFYKQRLNELSREIFLDQQWDLLRGLADRRNRDPRNFDLAMYQQAGREGRDPKQIKLLAQEAWALSDSRETLQKALEERGLYLSRGDRRSFTAMTWGGEVLSLPRLLDRKIKEVRERLGDAADLRSLDDTRAYVADQIAPRLQSLIGEAEQRKATQLFPLDTERTTMAAAHRIERERMDRGIAQRQDCEARERAESFRSGIAGLIDRLTGRHRQLERDNEHRAYAALMRDRAQRQAMIDAQLAERRTLQDRIIAVRRTHEEQLTALHRDLARQLESGRSPQRLERQQWLDERRRDGAAARQAWLQEQHGEGNQARIFQKRNVRSLQRQGAMAARSAESSRA